MITTLKQAKERINLCYKRFETAKLKKILNYGKVL